METILAEAKTIDDLLSAVAEYHPSPNLEQIRLAHDIAEKAHRGQTRKSGEPYITHPIAVAGIVAALRLDEASVCVALLHDTVEDTKVTLDDLERHFGAEIAGLVDGVTKLNNIKFNTKEEQQAENFRKMLIAMSRDIRVILVKLCDRVHNMRTLKHMPAIKTGRIAQETIDIFAPLANRLGISGLKTELEDLSFRYLYPDDYYSLAKKVEMKRAEREAYTKRVVKILEDTMTEAGIRADVSGRPKHLYSIWKKMKARGIDFEHVNDAVAFRLFVPDQRDCYHALGIVHSHWRPIPGRFKDYIALPKANMYQSLHTTVIGPDQQRVEIQIRTYEMHEVAEEGVAAHWKYKEGGSNLNLRDEAKFAWLKQLMEWQQELKDPKDFIDTVKIDLFSEEVYVFTPMGDVKALPKGATPVDFAYAVHTEVGHHCTGARIGGVMVPIDRPLRNGDLVEIITSKTQRPNPDWLNFVRTARAKNRIRSYLGREQRDRASTIGKELLEKALRHRGISLARVRKRKDLPEILRTIGGGLHSLDDLYARVGYNKVSPQSVVELLLPEELRRAPDKVEAPPVGKPSAPAPATGQAAKKRRSSTGIRVNGIEDVLIVFANCCRPLPGDPIVGFITRGRGVTVHTRDCRQVLASDPERLIDVVWDTDAMRGAVITVRVVTANAPGLLANMTTAITGCGVNIFKADCRTLADQRAINDFDIEVESTSQLTRVIRSLEQVNGVISVERVRS